MITPYCDSGIVLDIGTGDGRFVSASAKSVPARFFIGIDANAKPLEKLSIKITRKPAKGGLLNAMFVQAAVETLPNELDGLASEIYINFPWGSLLQAVAMGEGFVLESLRNVLTEEGLLTVTIGIDPTRDRAEMDRLGIPQIDLDYLRSTLAAIYLEAGLKMVECRELPVEEWSRIQTSWARKLGGNDERRVFRMKFARVVKFLDTLERWIEKYGIKRAKDAASADAVLRGALDMYYLNDDPDPGSCNPAPRDVTSASGPIEKWTVEAWLENARGTNLWKSGTVNAPKPGYGWSSISKIKRNWRRRSSIRSEKIDEEAGRTCNDALDFGKGVDDRSFTSGYAIWEPGFASKYVLLSLDRRMLRVETVNVFRDRSKRSSYRLVEYLRRPEEQID